MRALLALTLLTAGHGLATACPTEVATDDSPTTSDSCLKSVDFSRARRVIDIQHTVGAAGLTRSGMGGIASAFAGVDLAFGLQFGSDPEQPSYEIEISGGASVQRTEGAVAATGLATRGGLRLGPAQMAPTSFDTGRGNLAFFPMSLEASHAGEIAGRPRMSARPELARSLYNRQRFEVASRIVRVEGAGEKPQDTAPGLTTTTKPSAWSIDMITLNAGLDVAQQDATKLDASVGGALLAISEHTRGMSLEMLALEHRYVDMPMVAPTSFQTVWMLRIDAVNPTTGFQYRLGWGELIVTEELKSLAPYVNAESGHLSVGGAGGYVHRGWGGWGAQYRRDPFVTMDGQVGFEDRVSAEVFVPRALGLVGRGFVARTTLGATDTESKARHEVTAGVEVDATYTRGSWSTKVGVEVGRTYYTALDNTLPTTAGFGAAVDVSVQHASRRTWMR